MSFFDLVGSMDATVLSTFADPHASTLIVYPQTGAPAFSLPTVTKNPTLEEDYMPGSNTGPGIGPGTAVLLLFLHPPAVSAVPARGDTCSFNGVFYDIFHVDVDREGGYALKCRKRGTQ